jgi:hypothetical protein
VLCRIFLGHNNASGGDETKQCAQQIFHEAMIGGASPMAS